MNALIKIVVINEVAVGLRRCGKTTRDANACSGQIADHFAKGGVLATHPLDVVIAELVEGNYVFNQGDLSTFICKGLLASARF